MNKILLSRILDKTGVFGTIISGLSCAMCFPALASIGAAIGLGFLSRWEGLFVHILIPVFLVIALMANGLGWFAHHEWRRSALGCLGPIVALLGDQGMTHHVLLPDVARTMFYVGLVGMVLFALWDLLRPARKRCALPSSDNHPSSC